MPDPLQALVDRLSAQLDRPVLVDDAGLRPLAYSRQWGAIDALRSDSILSRGAPDPAREALLAAGIADARGPIRTPADDGLGMRERLCVPLRPGGTLVGYLWLLDPEATLGPRDVEAAQAAAERAAALLAPAQAEAALLRGLVAGDPAARAEVLERGLLAPGPVVVLAGTGAAQGRLRDGELAVVPAADVPPELPAGTGASARLDGLADVPAGARQARLALQVAAARPSRGARYADLGADGLLAQLPLDAWEDVPPALRRLLEDDPVLTRTLTAFLDARGDSAATARTLDLQRSGLYYRIQRIEARTGLDLGSGEDRLLAHVAVRLAARRSATM